MKRAGIPGSAAHRRSCPAVHMFERNRSIDIGALMSSARSQPPDSPSGESGIDQLDGGEKRASSPGGIVSTHSDARAPTEPWADLPSVIATALLSTRSDAIIAADKEGIIRYWNPGAERIFGYSSAEAVGKSLDIIIPERLRRRHWDGYDQAMKAGRSRYGEGDVLAVPAIRKDGARVSIEFTIVLLRSTAGSLLGVAAILRDVTRRFEELRELQRQLAARNG